MPTADGVPVPTTEDDCVCGVASSWTVILALRVPTAVGVKVTVMGQLPPGGSEPAAVQAESPTPKSEAAAPATVTPP